MKIDYAVLYVLRQFGQNLVRGPKRTVEILHEHPGR